MPKTSPAKPFDIDKENFYRPYAISAAVILGKITGGNY